MAISYNNTRAMNDAFLSGNVYRATGGGVTFAAISTAGNVDLFTDTAVVNDALYFKVSNQCNKFRGIEFSIDTAIASTSHTFAYEYRKEDSTWASLPGLVDNTAQFTVLGVNSITWTMPTDWGSNTTAVNGIVGHVWVRIRFSAITALTEGGHQSNTTFKVYDNAVRVDANHEYDSGTATAGDWSTITNTAKAYAVNELIGRSLYIHTGTGSGVKQYRIRSNTATVITIYDSFDTIPNTTSQYAIGANFEDLYQASVAGGWGVVTKAGSHMYAFNCFLDFQAGAFGEFNTCVEFAHDTYFYGSQASTNRYRIYLGYRLPLIYGLDRAVWGNMIVSVRESPIDNRLFGWGGTSVSQYTFLSGNKFFLRHDYPLVPPSSYLRSWMNSGGAYDISNRYEGWRSVLSPNNVAPKTETRNLEVAGGHSGIENPQANFSNVKTFYNTSLGIFVTGTTSYSFNEFDFGLNDIVGGNTYNSIIQFYGYQGTNTKYISRKGMLTRPMGDVFLVTSNGIGYPQNIVRMRFTDEKNNLLQNVRATGINGLGTQIFDTYSGTVGGFLNAQTVTSAGAYSLTTQPTAATRLQFTITGYTDISTITSNNARILIKGTDANGTTIKELIFLENVGNGVYMSTNEFLTVEASGIATTGWTGTMTVDMCGMIYPQTFDIEKWQSTNDTSLTTTDYNPFTFRIQKSGFEPVTITMQILRDQDWNIVLKRSVLKIG